MGDRAAAAASHREALTEFRALNDPQGLVEALNELGETLSADQDSETASICYHEALALAREIGDRLEEARALEGAGHCSLQEGDHDRAVSQLEQALAIYRRIGVPEARHAEAVLSQARAGAS